MTTAHEELFEREISLARGLIREAKYDDALHHLERAHILGQAQVRLHILSHWLMLTVALRQGQISGAFGQLVRLVLGAIGSAVGHIPVGNPGRSGMNMFRTTPIPPDLLAVMEGRDP